jgi:hypothetical protein
LHGCTKLIERCVFGLLRGRTEFLSKISENFVLKSGFACAEKIVNNISIGPDSV